MPQEAKPNEQPQPPDLDDISAGTADVPTVPDEKTEIEINELSDDAFAVRIARYRQDTEERKKYANRVFWLVVGWIAGMGAILFCQGFGYFTNLLDTPVLAALVGTSTVSVAGILYAVVKNLFHSN